MPVGEFRQFSSRQKNNLETVAASGPMNPFLQVLLRLLLGSIVWVVLGVLVILSALPYGGGNGDLLRLFAFSPLGLLAWALFPLRRLFKSSENGKDAPS